MVLEQWLVCCCLAGARTSSMAYDAQQWTYHGVGHRNDKLISFLSESCPLDTLPEAGSSTTTTTYFDADALVRCVFFSLRALSFSPRRRAPADIVRPQRYGRYLSLGEPVGGDDYEQRTPDHADSHKFGPFSACTFVWSSSLACPRDLARSLHTHNTSVVVPPPVAELRSWVQSQASGQSISKDFNAFEEFILLCCDGGCLREFAAESLNSTSVAVAISLCRVCAYGEG